METEQCYRTQLEEVIKEQQKNMSLFDYSGPKFTDDELRFRNITEKMRATFLKKNHDYGNSFHET